MRIAVLGAGALGSLLGGLLAEKHDVTLIGRRDHVDVVNARGLRITGVEERVVHPHAVTDVASARTPDLLLVTVKAYDTLPAVRGARRLIGPDTRVLSLQNGLGNLELVQAIAPEGLALGGATSHGATFVEPGHVRYAGRGYLTLGSPVDDADVAEEVADAFRAVDLDPQVTDNVHGEIWAKVVVNAGINPLTAITGLPNGALLEVPELKETMLRAVEEAVDVAKAEAVRLPDDDLAIRTMRVAEHTAENKSSMLQDVERGRRTEIDAISGEIWRRGKAKGVDTPVTMSLTALVKGIERTLVR